MSAQKKEQQLDLIFKALSDGTRRKILEMIAEEEVKVTDIAKPFQMSLNAISKHLIVLEKAGLLIRQKDGRVHRCRMDPKPLEPALDAINFYKTFWENQLDGLEKYLDETLKANKGGQNDY